MCFRGLVSDLDTKPSSRATVLISTSRTAGDCEITRTLSKIGVMLLKEMPSSAFHGSSGAYTTMSNCGVEAWRRWTPRDEHVCRLC